MILITNVGQKRLPCNRKFRTPVALTQIIQPRRLKVRVEVKKTSPLVTLRALVSTPLKPSIGNLSGNGVRVVGTVKLLTPGQKPKWCRRSVLARNCPHRIGPPSITKMAESHPLKLANQRSTRPLKSWNPFQNKFQTKIGGSGNFD